MSGSADTIGSRLLSGSLDPAGVDVVRLWRVAVPLRRPFVASHGVEALRSSTLVEVVRAGGVAGWGECPALRRPTYTGEYAPGAWRLLVDELVPAVLSGHGEGVRGHPMARFAVESALVDARLREEGHGLADALAAASGTWGARAAGGAPARARLERAEVVDQRADLDDTLSAVDAAVDGGATMVKLKVSPGHDRIPLGAVRRAFPDLALAADANGSYAGWGGDRLSWVDEFGLAFLEQPGDPDDLVHHAELARALATPIALDESVASAGTVRAAAALGALHVLNLKPARLGGLATSARVLAACAELGVAAFVGGMLELGVGRAAAVAVAALAGCALPTDLGPSDHYVDDDVTDPVTVDDDGRLVVPSGPGLGVEVRPDRLAAVALEVVELRP